MRFVALLLIPLVFAKTFDEMGYKMHVDFTEKCREWIIPYELEGNCTPVMEVYLKSGRLEVNAGKTFVFDVPGKYNILLERKGEIKVKLCVRSGEAYAEVDGNSEIACKKIPVIYASCEEKYKFPVGEKIEYNCFLENVGSLCTAVLPWPESPEFGAFFSREEVNVCPGEIKEVDLIFYTSAKTRLTDFKPICFKYSGAQYCTRRYPAETYFREREGEGLEMALKTEKKVFEAPPNPGPALVLLGALSFVIGERWKRKK